MSVKQELQIKEYNIVSKSNLLIEANSRLNLIEQKILLCLASNIEPNDKNFKTYTFPIKKFHDLLGLNGSTKYTELSKITKNLLAKVVEIHTGEELIQTSWLSSAIYNKKKGTIDMRFDPLLKPFLLELSNKFTSYRLGNIIKLKSIYSIRMYELLKQYEIVKERTILLKTLRYYVDAINIYPNYANFKQRILKPVQKELSTNTDISFEFKEIKKGRKVYKIKFYILSKKHTSYNFNYTEINQNQSHLLECFEMKIAEFEKHYNQKIHPKTLRKWEEYKDIILDIINYIQQRKDIESPIAYIEYMLNKHIQEKEQTSTQTESNFKETLNKVIEKFSTSTGTIATFLVKDTFFSQIDDSLSKESAQKIWETHEEKVMQKIYSAIEKNKRKARYKY
ncbi:replication initiation protein [Bacillus thuringiensis]|uniref:replication initiation protein n=1 Tax=Bacillus thuringiensis TaxID=1428 RepID=UPI0010ACD5D9|nr:replication initiation protein [Bacillus thuringiensis]TJZ99915.1 replication initiation protein [Bacillus thuringiensis]